MNPMLDWKQIIKEMEAAPSRGGGTSGLHDENCTCDGCHNRRKLAYARAQLAQLGADQQE